MDARLNELEIKVAFLDEQVSTLSSSLAREVRESVALADRVAMLEKALLTLAARTPKAHGGAADDVGANAETDPVPHSG